MLDRRSFLISAATLTLGQLVSGCSQNAGNLKVLLLQGSIPPQLTNDFRKNINLEKKINFQPEVEIKKIYNWLENWQNSGKNTQSLFSWLAQENNQSKMSALVTLGDTWLTTAIQKQLIQPLDLTQLTAWKSLDSRWQNLVKRDRNGQLAENGQIWGAPYRWGNTIIVYRRDKFKDLDWQPKDWQDLWHQDLRDRISIVDQPREVIGLTLKKLGYSYNTNDLNKIPNLSSELAALHQQIKFYSSDHYLEPLIIGDTWLAVGWSTDILPLSKRYSNLGFVVPQSGTSIWADLWVQPRLAESNFGELSQWINFCWRPLAANQISLFTNAISPVTNTMKPTELPQDLLHNSIFQASLKSFALSEFITPLSSQANQQYQELWQKIRQA
ncbi:extracellular solute-binding protein family 1 [Stanieria cyanosphaera PCC 7437]|uniref:Extracellular solute-binding protein family 1 n=1 Tax=Stanieria cyanosphaera (strain ATCC 29371 / PCC 7437) TaxID=111780 RepID=K9XQ74_STAC7|nr:extracellular solute-binding protein [Stanieria cyanosphaera]AFZ34244.1 extracellular solute-binding protein family 1 [Stanieria cyanosphaera PCC 7437]